LNKTQASQAKASNSTSINRQSRLFKSILNGLFDKKAENIVSIDLRKIPEAVADFFVVCEATTATQIKALADSVEKSVKEATGEFPYRQEGFQHAKWVLIDYVDVVIHIMHPDMRKFYQLEEMWSDAPQMEHHDR
jgi:ribosome-associated protein